MTSLKKRLPAIASNADTQAKYGRPSLSRDRCVRGCSITVSVPSFLGAFAIVNFRDRALTLHLDGERPLAYVSRPHAVAFDQR